MKLKQISLAIPENLFAASKEYCEAFGYRNIQEFIMDLLRRALVLEDIKRYREIEEKMDKGIDVKVFNQKDAIKYIKGL